jgi:hypothetical protein
MRQPWLKIRSTSTDVAEIDGSVDSHVSKEDDRLPGIHPPMFVPPHQDFLHHFQVGAEVLVKLVTQLLLCGSIE